MGDKYNHSTVDGAGYKLPELLEKLKRGDLAGFGRTEFLMGAIREELNDSQIPPQLKHELREYEKRCLVNDARRLLCKLKAGDFQEYSRPDVLVADLRHCLGRAEATPAALDPEGRATDREMLTQIRDAEQQARKSAARRRA